MELEVVNFLETKLAVVEHYGAPDNEYESVKKLVAWRKENKMTPPENQKSYAIHYNDPGIVLPSEYRVDLCVSVEDEEYLRIRQAC